MVIVTFVRSYSVRQGLELSWYSVCPICMPKTHEALGSIPIVANKKRRKGERNLFSSLQSSRKPSLTYKIRQLS